MAASISPKKARRRGKHFVIHVGYGDEAERVFRRWKGLKHKLRCQTDGELLMKVMDLAESELGLGSASFDRASLSVPTLTDDKLLNASVKEKLRAHLASLSRESSYEEKPMENDITDSRS